MNIDRFLGGKGISTLQGLTLRWSGRGQRSNSKASLLRSLRRAMLDPKKIEQQYELLDPPQKRLLRGLLQATQDKPTCALEFLPPVVATKQEIHAAISALVDAGFVGHRMEQEQHIFREELFVPTELAERLRKLLSIEQRSPLEIVSLEHFLRSAGEAKCLDLLEPFGLGELAGDPQAATEALAEPEAVQQRLNAGDEDFQKLFSTVLHEFEGIAPYSAVTDSFSQGELMRWRERIETSLLGTIGELPMHLLGAGDIGMHVVIFRELIDAFNRPVPTEDLAGLNIAASGVDCLIDVCLLCDTAVESPLRLTRENLLYKSDIRRLHERSVLQEAFYDGGEDFVEFKRQIAERCGLLGRTRSGRLGATVEYHKWEKRPIEDRVLQVFEVWSKPSGRGYRRLIRRTMESLASMPPGTWYPVLHPVRKVMRELMLDGDFWQRESSGFREFGIAPPGAHWPNFNDVCTALFSSTVSDLEITGLVDLAIENNRPKYIRLTPLGKYVLAMSGCDETAGPGSDVEAYIAGGDSEPGLIVNPDFEVLVLPVDDIHTAPISPQSYRLYYDLCRFCKREKTTHQTQHYRINKASVERAVIRGMSADEMIEVLHRHATTPVPQNVDYSLRGWAEGVTRASVEYVCIIEVDDEHAMETALNLEPIKPLVVRRLTPLITVLNEFPSDRKALEALRKAGIHVSFPTPENAE